jgi:hypothetical protein
MTIPTVVLIAPRPQLHGQYSLLLGNDIAISQLSRTRISELESDRFWTGGVLRRARNIHAGIHDGVHESIHDCIHESLHEGVHDRIHENPPRFLDRMPDVPTKQVLQVHLIPQGCAPRPIGECMPQPRSKT